MELQQIDFDKLDLKKNYDLRLYDFNCIIDDYLVENKTYLVNEVNKITQKIKSRKFVERKNRNVQENLTDNESDQEKDYSDNNISKNEDSDNNISEHEDSDDNQSEHIENYYSQDGIPYECTKEEIKIINYNITQLIDISCKLKNYF